MSSLEEGEILDEAAGALAGIPSHITKHMTQGYTAAAGENSDKESSSIKNKSNLHVNVSQGLSKGKHVVITKHGEVIGSLHSDGGNGGRATIRALEPDSKEAVGKVERHTVRGKYRYGRQEPDYHYTANRTELTKGEAIDHAHELIQKHGGFDGIEVHHIGVDKNRLEKNKARKETRGDDYAKYGKGLVQQRGSISGTRSLASGTKRAADKMIDNASGSASAEDKQTLKDLHAELGKHIEAGDHFKALGVAESLHGAINRVKHSGTQHDIDRAKWSGESLAKSGHKDSYDARRFVDNIRRLRNPEK